MRRTELAEQGIKELQEALEPVKTHVNHVEGALKLLGLLSVIGGLAATFIGIVQYLS
jgi:hypothetical protein